MGVKVSNLYPSIFLEPKQAVDFIAGKDVVVTWNWDDLAAHEHARAFTVAKMTQVDMLHDVKTAIEQAIRQGLTGKEFRKFLERRMSLSGWLAENGSPRRINTIFQTNVQSAFQSGRWNAFWDNRDNRPFLEYVAILDGSTRPTHRDIDGFIAKITDPVWRVIYPPNGFNCRCRTRALTEEQAAKRDTGVTRPKNFPDAGFSSNPGIDDDVKNMQLLYKKSIRAKSKAFARYLDNESRKAFLKDVSIPTIGATGRNVGLNVTTLLSAEVVLLSLSKPIHEKRIESFVDSVSNSRAEIYLDTKTNEILVKKKGTKKVFYVFGPTGVFKREKQLLFFGKRYVKL